MKKILFLTCILASLLSFSACSSNDEEETIVETTNEENNSSQTVINPIEQSFFTIENATYIEGSIPENTTEETISGVYCNNQALCNGGNFITISSSTEYEKFFVGVEGIEGYYEIGANNNSYEQATRAGSPTYFTYTIPVFYSVNLGNDFILTISGVTIEGYITRPHTTPITVVEILSGDLLINLVFDQNKDVDLHMIMPSGREIAYFDRGDYRTNENGEKEQLFGLDHDSNPSCNIDGLNNENISIPSAYVEKGKYKIIVNMYANCYRNIDLNYSLQATYKGNLLTNTLEDKTNPVIGYYPADAGRNDRTTIMEFYIDEGLEVDAYYNEEDPIARARRIPLSYEAKAKLMMKDDF